jgi:hypothetical protein
LNTFSSENLIGLSDLVFNGIVCRVSFANAEKMLAVMVLVIAQLINAFEY